MSHECVLLASDTRLKSSLIFGRVRRIALLRPGAVGDFLFALPALQALHAAYPRVRMTLLGSAWQAEFLPERLVYLDEVLVLPPMRGIGAAEDITEDSDAIALFIQQMRQRQFDLAVQMYGGGRYSNVLLNQLGARHTLGLRAADAAPLEHSLPYVWAQNERLRLLELVGLAGASVQSLDPRLALLPRDSSEAAARVPPDERPLVVLQPGASDPRRRWPAEKFAHIGDELQKRGARIVINGNEEETLLARAVLNHMQQPAEDVSGRLSLSGLCGLLGRACLLVSNDTGPLHLAHALRTPCVGIYWLSNLLISAPLTQQHHRAVLACRTLCPVCAHDNLHSRCDHNPSFVADVSCEDVLQQALLLFNSHHRQGGLLA